MSFILLDVPIKRIHENTFSSFIFCCYLNLLVKIIPTADFIQTFQIEFNLLLCVAIEEYEQNRGSYV